MFCTKSPTPVTLCMILTALLLNGCGKEVEITNLLSSKLPPIGTPSLDGVIVRSRAFIPVDSSSASAFQKFMGLITPLAYALSGNQPISVSNSPSSSMTLSNAQWNVPVISNTVIDFGNLAVTDLLDNDTKQCGANGNKKCGIALIRMYTTGAGGAGVWNSVDSYGAPIIAHHAGAAQGTVGLDAAGAVTLQSYNIPNNQHAVHETDFAPSPIYNVKADFTNAGAGTYSTTLVVEYALAP